jgi:hypothetical protein
MADPMEVSDIEIIREARKRFAICRRLVREQDRELIRDIIWHAGSQWGVAPSPEQIVEALNVAGFIIVRKRRHG